MKHYKLSVAVAAYNESANLDRFLKSLDWVDEIVLVDGNSTDDTAKIAQKYPNVRLISTDNKPMFHLNKQMAIDASKGDWILQLDVDEIVSPGLKKEINQIISQKDVAENGFWINRKNYFLGKFLTKGGQYPDSTLRLYKNGKGRLPCLSVHEQAVVSGKTGYLNNDLQHFSDPTFERYLMRNNRYTSLMALDLDKSGVKIGLISFLNYFFIKPMVTFFLIYFRHKGFMDGFPGFVFAYYSAISYRSAFIKYYGQKQKI